MPNLKLLFEFISDKAAILLFYPFLMILAGWSPLLK